MAQGAVSTIIEVLALSTSTSKIFRVFIPVFLTLFTCKSNKGEKGTRIDVPEIPPVHGFQMNRPTIVPNKSVMYDNHVFVNDNQYVNRAIMTKQTQMYVPYQNKS